jgi:hypothetical protein
VAGLDHVFLHIGSEPVLRAEDGRQVRPRVRREPIDDMPELAVNRCRVAHDPHAPAVEIPGIEQAIGTKTHTHRAIIKWR